MTNNTNIDPRREALERGLRQCSIDQLHQLLEWIEDGKPLLLDRGPLGESCAVVEVLETDPPQVSATYSPLAVAAGWRESSTVVSEHDEYVRQSLADMHPRGWEANTTRGVDGQWFRANRRFELKASAMTVLGAKLDEDAAKPKARK